MRDLRLINNYRVLDKDSALFFYKLNSGYHNETKLFIPDIDYKDALEAELQSLIDRAKTIEKPDDVFSLIQGHYMDFLGSQKVTLKNAYERPSSYINIFLNRFSHMTRKDSRSDVEKAEVLIDIFSQADEIWKGIMTWIDNVSFLYLQELVDSCQLYIDTMMVEVSRIPKYFPNLNDKQQDEVVNAIQILSGKMLDWINFIKRLMEEKGMVGTDSTTEDDIIKFEESYYRLS